MNNDITAAQKLSVSVETTVEGLTPANYNNNHSLLLQYYSDLMTSHSDNQAAYNEAKTILRAL